VNDANNATTNARRTRVLRFEFSNDIIEHLAAFVQIHQYDDRKTYKTAWAEWMANDEIATIFNADAARLKSLGYTGDVADKLYKSGRYYFRQKTYGFPNLSLQPEPMGVRGAKATALNQGSPRRYVLLSRELLSAMDDHIERGLRQTDFTPAKGFADFDVGAAGVGAAGVGAAGAAGAVYPNEIARLSEMMPTGEDVINKLKKTYKNRYFIIAKSTA
jgi:hypothetical protein